MAPVTIITPSYNQGPFLEETIRSVLEQDYPDIEYLVIDGGSTDGTLDILRRHEQHLTWVCERDAGQSDALNKGFRRARGEVIAWLNSDDVYLPGAVRRAVEFLEQHPSVAMVYGDADYIDQSGKLLGPYFSQHLDLAELALSCFVCQPTVFLRRQAVADVGWLDPTLHYTMDYDLWIRLAQRYPVAYLPEKLACYRAHPGAKTFAHRDQSYEEAIRIVKKRFGYVAYPWLLGLADYRVNRADQFFDRRPITPLARWAALALFIGHNLGSGRGVRHLFDHFAGRASVRWPNGAVTREFRLSLRQEPGDRFVEFHGQHLFPAARLTLDVYYNGALWDQIVVRRSGPFVATVELPEATGRDEPHSILLRTETIGRFAPEFCALSFVLDDVLIVKDYILAEPPRRVRGFRPTRDTLAKKGRGDAAVAEVACR